MARGATVVVFDIELADVDRGVYETLSLKVGQHPSETAAYLLTRVLAYALEHTDGLAFTQGLFNSEEPALEVRDLTGQLQRTIEVGFPEATRLHKASKASDSVVVYGFKEPGPWLASLAGARVHDTEHITLRLLPPASVRDLADGLQRRNQWSLSVMEGVLYLEVEGTSHTLTVQTVPWPS